MARMRTEAADAARETLTMMFTLIMGVICGFTLGVAFTRYVLGNDSTISITVEHK